MEQPTITPQEQEQIDRLAEAVATDLANGLTPGAIAKSLVKEGWDQAAADGFVAQVQTAMTQYRQSPQGQAAVQQAHRDRNQRNMTYGALWCIGGTVVTGLTYAAASGGGTYVVAWGAIIFGGIQFLSGLFGSMRDG
jgi:hypothetical protein